MAVRSQTWRYIRYHDGSEELYNLEMDPSEHENLAGKEEYKEVIEQHARWIPDTFAMPVAKKEAFYFDPYAFTFLDKETKAFIDGKKL